MPLFFDFLREFSLSDATAQSRRRIRIIFDDTEVEWFGWYLEFIHKLYDHTKVRRIMGYNHVLMPAVSGDTAVPLSFVLQRLRSIPITGRKTISLGMRSFVWKRHATDGVRSRSGRTALRQRLSYAESHEHRWHAGFRAVSKADNRYKHEYEEALLKSSEIIEKVSLRHYQRIIARHHVYGDAVQSSQCVAAGWRTGKSFVTRLSAICFSTMP